MGKEKKQLDKTYWKQSYESNFDIPKGIIKVYIGNTIIKEFSSFSEVRSFIKPYYRTGINHCKQSINIYTKYHLIFNQTSIN